MADTSKAAALRTEVAQAFSNLKDAITEAEPDMTKFTVKENASAGTRLREAMQKVKGLAQDIRLKTQAAKNAE